MSVKCELHEIRGISFCIAKRSSSVQSPCVCFHTRRKAVMCGDSLASQLTVNFETSIDRATSTKQKMSRNVSLESYQNYSDYEV